MGDSPIIGAGVYVDQEEVGGARVPPAVAKRTSSICGAHTVVENMRQGMPPKDAILDALKRISRNYNHDKTKLAQFDINFYALRKDGVYSRGIAMERAAGGSSGRQLSFPWKFAVN
ncbi:MAG: hypothetical protein U5J83_09200 [Bryobacterales bacterium]|nr:hypothetical protein [Bryobacterales bacterium]